MCSLTRRFARASKDEAEEIDAVRNAIMSDGCDQLDYFSVKVALAALDLKFDKDVLNKVCNQLSCQAIGIKMNGQFSQVIAQCCPLSPEGEIISQEEFESIIMR